MEGRGRAAAKRVARDLGAFICFEDEAGQGLRPPKSAPGRRAGPPRGWGPRCGAGRVSIAGGGVLVPSGDSAAPITGTPRLSKFSWLGSSGPSSGDTVTRNNVTSATPGRSPPWETTITKCRPSALPKGSPPTGDTAFPTGTSIATEPVKCPSLEARTTTSRPATTT